MNNLMRRSGIVAVLCLVLSLMLVITACGGDDPVETTGAPETTAPEVTTAEPDDTTAEPDDTTAEPVVKVTYTVTVKDTEGNPIAGATVQICEGETCIPGTTNAEGVATIEAVEGVYEASVTKATGYVTEGVAKVALENNAATITLAKAPEAPVAGDKIVITETMEEAAELELKANVPVTYTYTAPSKGVIGITVLEGKTVSVVVNNVTTGKVGQKVNGIGSAIAVAKAGDTYEIVVTATADETVEVGVSVLNFGDGTKESPFIIQNLYNLGGAFGPAPMVEDDMDYLRQLEMLIYMGIVPNNYYDNVVDVELEAGKTVWYNVLSAHFEINDPSINVNFMGTQYPCDQYGNRVFDVIDGDLYLNGNLLFANVYSEDLLFGFSAAADATAEVVLRNGSYDLPFWTTALEGPYTIVPEDFFAYELVPGSYEDGVYYVSFDAEDGLTFGRTNFTVITVDSDEYDNPVFVVVNMDDEDTISAVAEVVDITDLEGTQMNPIEVELGKTYAAADHELALKVNSGAIYFYYEATEAGTFSIENKGDCQCGAFIQLNLNTDSEDWNDHVYGDMGEPIEVEEGDVVFFVLAPDSNWMTGETCDDCAFSASFTLPVVETETSAAAGDTSAESSTPELELQ